jgi:hypothetical protein
MNRHSITYGAVAKWQGEGRQNLFGGSIPPRAPILVAHFGRRWMQSVINENRMHQSLAGDLGNSTFVSAVFAKRHSR